MLSLRRILTFTAVSLARCHPTAAPAQSCSNPASQVQVPSTFLLEDAVAQFVSCNDGYDGPKVSPINATAYDWWYFDAVSDDGSEALTVVFFTASVLGFPFQLTSAVDATTVAVFATFADGSTSVAPLLANGATITTTGNGASGTWKGVGSFTGAPDLSSYNVSIDASLLGVQGTFQLTSHGPGHFPCDPLVSGVNEQLVPHVGWVNVLPAAMGVVDFTINGRNLKFSGSAYHDKNWGDIPFTSAVKSWYWGHGTLGPYDLVWFDAIASDGVEYVSGYVVKNGQVAGSTCSNLRVRPVGTQYPPTILSEDPNQYTLTMLLNDGRNISATITKKSTQVNVGLVARWIGIMNGTIGDETYSGSALWDQFKLTI